MTTLAIALWLIDVFVSANIITGALLIIVGLLLFPIIGVYIFAELEADKEKEEELRYLLTFSSLSKWATSIFTVCLILNLVVPSEKTMYMMVGLVATDTVLEATELDNELVKSAENVLKLVNKNLEELTKDE